MAPKYIVCCRILSQPDTESYCLRSCENNKTKSTAAWGSEPSAVNGPSCWEPRAMSINRSFADPQRAAGTQQYHPMLWIFHPKERRQGILSEIRESFLFCFQSFLQMNLLNLFCSLRFYNVFPQVSMKFSADLCKPFLAQVVVPWRFC